MSHRLFLAGLQEGEEKAPADGVARHQGRHADDGEQHPHELPHHPSARAAAPTPLLLVAGVAAGLAVAVAGGVCNRFDVCVRVVSGNE